MPMYNRRWLEEPEMTYAEVRRWVSGPRLNEQNRTIVETRSFEERAVSMEKSSEGMTGVARINADKIIRELRSRVGFRGYGRKKTHKSKKSKSTKKTRKH